MGNGRKTKRTEQRYALEGELPGKFYKVVKGELLTPFFCLPVDASSRGLGAWGPDILKTGDVVMWENSGNRVYLIVKHSEPGNQSQDETRKLSGMFCRVGFLAKDNSVNILTLLADESRINILE